MIQIKDSTDQSDSHMLLIIKLEFASWLMLFTSKKPKPTISPSLMLMDLKPLIKIKPKLKNGAKSTTFFQLLIQLPNKSQNFQVMFQSNWANSQLLSLKDKNQSQRSKKLDTQLNSNQRRPHAQALLLEQLILTKKT